MKVLITGATGFVGQTIVKELLSSGNEVVVLSRNIARAAFILGNECEYFQWSNSISELPPKEAFDGVDAVINLMGAGIADKRWDEERKKMIYDSRVLGTRNLVEGMKALKTRPKSFVSASAVGIYGNRNGEDLTENSQFGDDFLAHVCKDWEAEAMKAKELGIRTGVIRTGVVLGRNGGALKRMLPVFKMGVGGQLGTGEQYMSWIHLIDLAHMYIEFISKTDLEGPYNGTAPYPATNLYFTKALGKTLKRPTFAKAPAFALKAVLGEMSTMLLGGQKVLPRRFKEEGFRYRYPTLEMALKETAF